MKNSPWYTSPRPQSVLTYIVTGTSNSTSSSEGSYSWSHIEKKKETIDGRQFIINIIIINKKKSSKIVIIISYNH